MSWISGEGVGKNYGPGYVFRDVCFALQEGDRVGLVGPNGHGKTTLVRILAGLEEPTTGQVQRRRGLRIGYLPQDRSPAAGADATPAAPGGQTLWQFGLEVFSDLARMEADLAALAEALGRTEADADLLARYGALQQEFERRGGYAYHLRAEQVLAGLGFAAHQFAQPMAHQSGGQRSRATLARVLLSEPDVLLLDEPTNHLDLDALDWLERYLESFRGAMVIVSHDRYFLDRVTGRIWEMAAGRLDAYRGNYSEYNRQRHERLQQRRREYQARQELVARTEEFIRRNVGARRVGVAQGRRTRLQRLLKQDAVERPPEDGQVRLRFGEIPRSGNPVFRTEGMVCGYERARPLLGVSDLDVLRGQRVAVIGANGTGKTTLLRTLLGQIPALSGAVRRGANLRLGWLAQTHDDLEPSRSAVENVQAGEPDLTPERARGLLGGLGLGGDDALRPVAELSGGQRSRVVLARLIAQKANVLLLDEPTNHLDIPSQEALEAVLAEYPGTVIFVTHDRYLVRALAGRVWAIADGGVHDLAGGWQEFRRWQAERSAAAQAAVAEDDAGASRQAHRRARRQANRLQAARRRQQDLEEHIRQTEGLLMDLGHRITQAGEQGVMDQVHDLGRQYQQAERQLKRLWDQWTQTTEELERLEGGASDQAQ